MLRHLKAWLRRGRLDDELREELAQHVAWKTESLIADGVPEAEARRRAARRPSATSRGCARSRARVWGFPSIDSDRPGRPLRRAPDAARARRSPRSPSCRSRSASAPAPRSSASPTRCCSASCRCRDPDSLVLLQWTSGPVFPFSSLNGNGKQNADGSRQHVVRADRVPGDAGRRTGQRRPRSAFADLYDVNVSIDGRAEIASAHVVSGNYFDVLGVPPADRPRRSARPTTGPTRRRR